MEQTKPDLPVLQPGEKVLGHAYLTEDGEIVFTPHSGNIEVLLVEAQPGASGPWAIRQRPAPHTRSSRAAHN